MQANQLFSNILPVSLYSVSSVCREDSTTFLVLNLGFVRLPERAKLCRGRGWQTTWWEKLGVCMNPSQHQPWLAGWHITWCPPEMKHGRPLHNPASTQDDLPAVWMCQGQTGLLFSQAQANVVLRQFWCPLHRHEEVYGTFRVLNSQSLASECHNFSIFD